MERVATAAPAKEPSAGERVAATRPSPARAATTDGGDYFVQIGAFKEQDTARRLAAWLREQNYPVDESVKRVRGSAVAEAPRPAPRVAAVSAASGDRYEVIVTGPSATEINAKLRAKGLTTESDADGVRISPSLPLRDAVALSKDLNNEGFKVQVRRGGPAPVAVAEPAGTAPGERAETLYRVRVGGYPDRETAQSVMRALQGKGYQAFIAKGRE